MGLVAIPCLACARPAVLAVDLRRPHVRPLPRSGAIVALWRQFKYVISPRAYEVIRKRARADGRSIQSYMRDWVVDFAGHPTAQEVMVALEAALASHDTPGASRESIQAALAADRR